MINRELKITISYKPQPALWLQGFSSEELQDKLLDKGYEHLVLAGALVEEFGRGIFMFVDAEAGFLMDYYMDLEELFLSGDQFDHNAHLGDGVLTVESKSDGKNVEVKLEHCPGLNVANLVTHTTTISTNEYMWWWRSIAQQIIATATAT